MIVWAQQRNHTKNEEDKNMKEPLSIVYDMTRRCPWNCAICCMGASSKPDACRGELPQERKLSLMDELPNLGRPVRIDFSGGELMTNPENLLVIDRAAARLGRDQIGISVSGWGIDADVAARLSACVAECEMTMDTIPGRSYYLRPDGYAAAAAKAVPLLRAQGVRAGIQTVLACSNTNAENLTELYRWLCENSVDEWSLLRFYPSGRGEAYPQECLSPELEHWAVRFIQQLDRDNPSPRKPSVNFHYTMAGHPKSSSECRCVRKSIGILPDGQVTACFWAVDANTGIVEPKFLLGSLKESSLKDILNSTAAAYWTRVPHCCELCPVKSLAA